jgi:hypothetical protein
VTIIVSTLIPSGIVIAADSRQVSRSVGGLPRVISDLDNKLFRVNSHTGVAICGQGTFYLNNSDSPVSFSKILHRISKNIPEESNTKETAHILHSAILELSQKNLEVTNKECLGTQLFVGGINLNDDVGELYRCKIPGGIICERTTKDAGLVWGGARDVIERLIFGYDLKMFEEILMLDTVKENKKRLEKIKQKYQYLINFQTMPLQEAINISKTLIETTIGIQKISDGLIGYPGQFSVCGGVVDVAVITPEDGFIWVSCKKLTA